MNKLLLSESTFSRCKSIVLSIIQTHVWFFLISFFVISIINPIQAWSFYNSQIHPEEIQAREAKPSSSVIRKDHVFILEDSSFNDFIKTEASVLVLFYAPWCHWCRELLPRYAEAASLLSSQTVPVKLAQIDATKNQKVGDQNDITIFPTIKFFLDGQPHQYDGGRKAPEIVKWVTTHLKTEIVISNDKQLDTLMASNRDIPTLIAHFDKSIEKENSSRKTFLALSRKLDNIGFADVDDRSVITRLIETYNAPAEIKTMKEFLVMINPHFQKQPEVELPVVLFSGRLDDADALSLFVKTYLFPALMDFDAEIAPRAFKDGRPILVLFTTGDTKAPITKLAIDRTRELGKKYRHDIVFIHSDGHSIFDKRLQALLGVEQEKLPTIQLFHPNPNGHGSWYSTLKYRPSIQLLESFDIKGLEQFIQDFKNAKLKPFVRSEPIPYDNSGPVKVLVADQFDDLVSKSKNDVLVEFYAPWCGHCVQLQPIYNKVGSVLLPVKHVDVMKMDATQNEVNLVIMGYPTLVLFVNDAEKPNEKKAIYYGGERTVDAIVEFVAENSSRKFKANKILKPLASDLKAREMMKSGDAVNWQVEEL